MIPYGKQHINAQDIAAVEAVLRSDFLTQGPVVPRFEHAIAEYCDVKFGVAVNSATSALHIACLALDVGVGDIVWTTPNTFVASANCARYCGADVDFVDIDPTTLNLCPIELEKKLSQAKSIGKLPKVLIPVHFSGESCDMEKIFSLSKEYGFSIIEDASHAIGGEYEGTKIGSCKYSDITIFSFHPVKIITTAEGGLATTNDPLLARKMQLLRSHGITREPDELTNNEGGWYYEQQLLGFNYRMTEMQAALGLSQIEHLDEWIRIRHAIADRYDSELKHLPLILPKRSRGYSALHLYVIQLDESKTNIKRKDAYDSLKNSGIGVNIHYIPVHLQPDYSQFGFRAGNFPNSEIYYKRALSIPMFATLSKDQQTTVINSLKELFKP